MVLTLQNHVPHICVGFHKLKNIGKELLITRLKNMKKHLKESGYDLIYLSSYFVRTRIHVLILSFKIGFQATTYCL